MTTDRGLAARGATICESWNRMVVDISSRDADEYRSRCLLDVVASFMQEVLARLHLE